MSEYTLAVICPECESVILGGRVRDMTNQNGVVLLDLFACESFQCESCGTIVYTGDTYSLYEWDAGEDL